MKEYSQYLEINPKVRFGKVCAKGTRITVGDILEALANDMTTEELLEDFPELKKEHIKAALLFAANRELMGKLIAA